MEPFRKYLKFKPSSADRWAVCAASAIADSIQTPYEPSIYAATGTGVMKKIETVLSEFGDESDFDSFVGTTETVDGNQVTYTEEDMEAAKVCFREISTLEASGGKVLIELSLEGEIGVREKAFCRGRLDFLAEFADHYTIEDYKHGAGVPVNAVDNKQLFTYLMLVIAKFGPKDWYELKIIQPRSPGARESTWTVKHKDFEKIVDGLDGAIVRANKAAREMGKTGEIPMSAYTVNSHCKWCTVEKTCPGRINLSVSVAAMTKFAYHPGGHLKFLLDYASAIRETLKGVEEQADAELLAGREVFGYKLIESQGNRSLRKNLSEVEIEALRCAKLVQKIDKMPTIAELEKAEKQGKIKKAADFLAEGEKKPKRVTWETEGTPWGSADEFEEETMEKTEE